MSFPRSGSLDRMEWKRTCTLITTVWDQLGSPLGRRGMRVLKVPQLSDQPCRHSTGRPSSGPQTLPLSCPHGTGMDSSESGHETFCLLCTQTGAAAPLHVAMGPKRTRRGVFCRFSKPEHCAAKQATRQRTPWELRCPAHMVCGSFHFTASRFTGSPEQQKRRCGTMDLVPASVCGPRTQTWNNVKVIV